LSQSGESRFKRTPGVYGDEFEMQGEGQRKVQNVEKCDAERVLTFDEFAIDAVRRGKGASRFA
jgi:hypothetical protein